MAKSAGLQTIRLASPSDLEMLRDHRSLGSPTIIKLISELDGEFEFMVDRREILREAEISFEGIPLFKGNSYARSYGLIVVDENGEVDTIKSNLELFYAQGLDD